MVGGKESKLQHAWGLPSLFRPLVPPRWHGRTLVMEALQTAQRGALFWDEAYIDLLTTGCLRISNYEYTH
jgi:hypothetical protein